eukprot:5847603-Pleurochrysis_carterae.AAC.1
MGRLAQKVRLALANRLSDSRLPRLIPLVPTFSCRHAYTVASQAAATSAQESRSLAKKIEHMHLQSNLNHGCVPSPT